MTTYIGTHRRYWVIPERSTVSSPEAITDFDPVALFVTRTGTVHLLQRYSFGIGPACAERYMFGKEVSGLGGDVTCKTCTKQRDA